MKTVCLDDHDTVRMMASTRPKPDTMLRCYAKAGESGRFSLSQSADRIQSGNRLRSDLFLVCRHVLGLGVSISGHALSIPLSSQTHRTLIHRAVPTHFSLFALNVLDWALRGCSSL